MTTTIIVEQTNDGFFSCYTEEEFPEVGLLGYGSSSKDAVDNLISFYNEMKEQFAKEGKSLPELEFKVRYDMASFFNRFDYLKISKVAEYAGINASLMRKYVSGVATPGPKQYDRLSKAIKKIAQEMASAEF